jgi:ribosomal protein S12 methylthiotransferase
MKIALITLGCPKNLVDAEVMMGLLCDSGHELVGDLDEADVAIVNTCSFIASAFDESKAVIERCMELRVSGTLSAVVVAGCLPQRYGEATLEIFPHVDGVVGCSAFHEMPEILSLVELGERPLRVREPVFLYDHLSPRILGTPAHLAYIKIAEGCDNRCAYCTIPSIRGAQRSREPQSILEEARDLADLGVRELNLIAQDTTAYGTDIASSIGLPELLSSLGSCGAPWVRVLYTHPEHVTDELLGVMREEPCVVPYIDVPVQHVSGRILRSMGRAGAGQDVREILERIREGIPGVTIRSSVMVGFPGETDSDFEELVGFVRAGYVDYLGIFEFSPEPGTPAAGFRDQVDAAAAGIRARQLVKEMRSLASARGADAIGTDVVVLVDTPSSGRTSGQAWELDGGVLFEQQERCLMAPGDFWAARVTGTRGFDLVASPLGRLERPFHRGESA